MFLIDDLLLAVVIAIFILLATTLTSALLCFLGLLIGCGGKSDVIGGAAKKAKELKAIDKVKSNVDILLKSYTDSKQTFNPVMQLIEKYGYMKPTGESMTLQDKRISKAKSIYKKEKADSKIFDIEYEKVVGSYNSTSSLSHISTGDKNMTKSVIDKLMHYRTLENDYPTTTASAYTNWSIAAIEYTPTNKEE